MLRIREGLEQAATTGYSVLWGVPLLRPPVTLVRCRLLMDPPMFDRVAGLPIRELILVGWMPSRLKAWWYRRRGYRIDPSVRFDFGSVIIADDVEIGPETRVGILVIIKARTLRIGGRVRIGHLSVLDTFNIAVGEGTRIGNQVVVGGLATPSSSFQIGRNCILMEWSFINTTLPVTVGDDVGIGGHCLFFTHGLWPNGFEGFPVNFGAITIEDEAWLAWRVSVLPGVTIGARSILSSDACVTKNIPALALAAGVPAKVLRENGTYITPVDARQNESRLAKLINEFCEWVTFHGGRVESRTEAVLHIAWDKDGRQRGRILLPSEQGGLDALVADAGRDDVVTSLPEIPDEVRRRIEARGAAWLDIAMKERSRTTNSLSNELEEFLRRAGLRLLKYERRARSPAHLRQGLT
jgi:acetyltransferase-like isoleucine patch superfamily enzyme